MPDARLDNDHADLHDRPAAELLRQLSEQTATLVRQELELAKAELSVKGKKAGLGAGMFGGAGVVGFYAVGALTACIILALSTAMAGWLAALIVTVIYGGLAGALALTGKSKVQEATPPVPERTVTSVRADLDQTKRRAQEGRR